jgi:hypothetical protein
MKKTVRKIFFVWEYEKEEQWLNEMSKQGWQLTKATFGKFRFESGTPDEYTYRLELLDKSLSSKENTSYLNFLQDTGIEMVGECRQWIYLRCKTANGGFEPTNRTLYTLTHLLKIQEFIGTTKNKLVAMIALAMCGLLVMEQLDTSNLVDFIKGFCTGIGFAASFVTLAFNPFSRRINRKVKATINELYTCE